MANKVYVFDKINVFFKHTDMYGFVHPYNYLEWMSYARESFFQDLVSNFRELCDGHIKMVTYGLEINYYGDAIFGDHIEIRIHSKKIKKLSFDVVFEFYNTRDDILLAGGTQTLTFLDGRTMRPSQIPDELKAVVLEYERAQDKYDLSGTKPRN